MQRTETGTRGFSPYFDEIHAIPGFGGQVDWSRVSDDFFQLGKFTVKLNGAAAIGADALTVDALPYALKQGDILRAPDVPTVTVTFSAAAQGATTVGVTALSAALPNGAVFRISADEYVTLTAAAVAGATSLTTEALVNALEGGETGVYQGGEHNIEVLEDVAAGATSVPIGNLQFALADNTEITGDYSRTNDGKMLPIGLHISRTSTNKIIPRRNYDADAGDVLVAETLTSDAYERSKSAAKSGYGTISQANMYENLMPDADADGNLPADYKTELSAGGFKFTDWKDSRVS